MAHSVEGRFPFLDHRLVTFCGQLHPGLKLRGLTEKFLLKEASRPWLPEAIRTRTKRPYRAPIHKSFFHGRELEYVEDLLSPATVAALGLFRPGAVQHLKAKVEEGRPLGETDDMALVGILSTHLLVHQFLEHFPRPDPVGGRDDVKVVALSWAGG
jgi:asparagine synthase (glutamine-hydrolysing)